MEKLRLLLANDPPHLHVKFIDNKVGKEVACDRDDRLRALAYM